MDGKDGQRASLVQCLLLLRASFPASESQLGWGYSLLQAGWSPPRTQVGVPPLVRGSGWAEAAGNWARAGQAAARAWGQQCHPRMWTSTATGCPEASLSWRDNDRGEAR